MQSDSWKQFRRKTLLIGDSLLKAIDQDKLVNTEVHSMSGVRVEDVKNAIINDTETYDQVAICVGTNNCSDSDMDTGLTMASYKELIAVAQTKVNSPSDVVIASIPPRTDKEEAHARVASVNAELCVIAAESRATFVDNDATFHLADKSVNDGYLMVDGIHLTYAGVNRLAKTLHPRNGVTDITKRRRPQSDRPHRKTPAESQNSRTAERHKRPEEPQEANDYRRGSHYSHRTNNTN